MQENEQEIVKEYFEKQKNSKFKLCIYEEKASRDIEWFYDANTDEWCYLKQKNKRYQGETYEMFSIERKRFKTFGKKCHVAKMSSVYFMMINAFDGFETDELTVDDVKNYTEWFKKEKENNRDLTLNEFNQILRDRRSKNRGCLSLVLGFICIPIALIFKICGA